LKKFSANPFQVRVLREGNLTEILLDAFAKDVDDFALRGTPASRWRKHNRSDVDWLALRHLRRSPDGDAKPYLVGTVFRLRLTDLQERAGIGGFHELDLGALDGLGHNVAFLWDPSVRMLWLQHDPKEVGHGMFARYAKDMGGKGVVLTPVFVDKAIDLAKRLGVVKSLEFAFLTDRHLNPTGAKAWQTLNALDKYGAAVVEVKFKAKRDKVLDDDAMELAAQMADMVSEDEVNPETRRFRKAKVVGRLSPEEGEMLLDLIDDRDKYNVEIPASKNRNAGELMDGMIKLWIAYRDQLPSPAEATP
jgi:hypothetical protein